MKKSKSQKRLLWRYRKIPCFWVIINDHEKCMSVMNWVTGEHDVLDK